MHRKFISVCFLMDDEHRQKPLVLFLPRWYPYREDPMLGLFVRNHALALRDKYRVAVLFVKHDPLAQSPVHFDIGSEDGIFTVRVYYRVRWSNVPLLSMVMHLITYLLAHYRGAKMVKKYVGKPTLNHVHVLTRLGMLAMLAKKIYKIPYVITEHWSRYQPYVDGYHGVLRKLVTRYVVKNAAGISTVSFDLMRVLQSHHLNNAHYVLVNNVVDTNLFKPCTAVAKHQKKRLIHISCFEDRSKNISGLLRVVRDLSSVRDDFELIMVGDGMDFLRITKEAQDLVQRGVVCFTGVLEGAVLAGQLCAADGFVMFSNYENMPVVIGEALACGVPVLATDVGGIAEHINSERGVLVPAGDEQALYRQMNWFLDNFDHYNQAQLRQYAVTHFGVQAVCAQFDNLYKTTIH